MDSFWDSPGVDPRFLFLVVVLVVLISLTLLGDLYKTMLVLSVTTSTLITSLALIGIFNHGDLHKGKKVREPPLADELVHTYLPGSPFRGYRNGSYYPKHLAPTAALPMMGKF